MVKQRVTVVMLSVYALCGLFWQSNVVAAPPSGVALGEDHLVDFHGKDFSFSTVGAPYKVIAFLGTECPLAKLYSTRLNTIASEYSPDVAVIGVMSNVHDSLSEIAAFVERGKLRFPVLKDRRNRLADELKAQRTPEVFLLNANDEVVYRGRIDDQYGVGYNRSKPRKSDLRDAIRSLLSGKPIAVSQTNAVGCLIGRVSEVDPTGDIIYSDHIVPLLESHCVECHREGNIAPFSLTSYDEVVGWAEMICEVISSRRMPPWHAHPNVGSFKNSRGMSETEIRQFCQWVRYGMPRGRRDREPRTAPRVQGWRLPRSPDIVVKMSAIPYQVPAQGTVEYQYFVADPGFETDKWVSAAEVIPGNRSVVHHAIVFVRPPEGERQDGIGWLAAYVPGQSLMTLPVGVARRIPSGSKLVFQMHYTPTGVAEEDLTQVGLLFADEESIREEMRTRLVVNRGFEIPPRTKDFAVTMSGDGFPPGSKLLAIAPHMHYRGSAFRVNATHPSRSQTLLEVPDYDFNWQHAYVLSTPLDLENVRIDCEAVFDNTDENLANPDPSKTVTWGDQTWEEMALAYLAITVPVAKVQIAEPQPNIPFDQSNSARKHDRPSDPEQLTRSFFEKLDVNRDGEIVRAETPKSFRAFAWRYYDRNHDGKLVWKEVYRQAQISLMSK